MTTLARRLIRLGRARARLRPLPLPPVDEARLARAEWAEVAQIGEITKAGGLAALSDADLAECLARQLAGEEVAACLG